MENIFRIIVRNPPNIDLYKWLVLMVVLCMIQPPINRGPLPCISQTCIRESLNVRKQVNPDVNPCDNFYNFICGGYQKIDNIPIDALREKIRQQMIDIYTSPYKLDDHVMFTMQKKFYSLCQKQVKPFISMDVFLNNTEILREVTSLFGGWPMLDGDDWDESKFDWVKATHAFSRRGFSHNMFLNISVDLDPRNNNRHIFKISLADPIFIPTKSMMQKYEILLGAKMQVMSDAVDELMTSADLFSIQLQMESFRSTYIAQLLQISSIQNQYPSQFDWLNFINEIVRPIVQLRSEDYILINNPIAVVSVIKKLSKIPKRILANFMILRIFEEAMAATLSFSECFEKIQETFQNFLQPLDNVYMQKYLNYDMMNDLKQMIGYVGNAALKVIKGSVQIKNKHDKKIILNLVKTAAKNIVIGAPPDIAANNWVVDSKEDKTHNKSFYAILSEYSFLNMFLFIEKLKRFHIFKKVYHMANTTRFHQWNLYEASQNVLDFYLDSKIVLPLPILQDFFFNQNRPNYMNYGALGTFIAAELANKIANALQFEDDWSNKTMKSVLAIRKCLLGQLKDYTVIENAMGNLEFSMLVQGLSTKISYLAYRKWEKKNGIEPRLSLNRYTNKQLFWISTGVMFCHKPHFGRNNRLQGHFVSNLVMNNDDFAKDFQCRSRAKMNPFKKCSLT